MVFNGYSASLRSKIDDLATLARRDHGAAHFLCDEEATLEIDCNRAIPIGNSQIFGRSEKNNSCTVYSNINLSECLDHT